MDALEKLTQKLYNECIADGEPVTIEEAREMAEMELKARSVKRYEHAEAQEEEEKKPRKKREPKLDPDKMAIIEILNKALCENGYRTEVANVQREIKINDNAYSVTLIAHRNKKTK